MTCNRSEGSEMICADFFEVVELLFFVNIVLDTSITSKKLGNMKTLPLFMEVGTM